MQAFFDICYLLAISFSDFPACHFSLNSDQNLEASKWTVFELMLDD